MPSMYEIGNVVGPATTGFMKGYEWSRKQSLARQKRAIDAQRMKLQLGSAFADLFKPGQSSAVTELKMQMFARVMGIDPSGAQFKDIVKFAKGASDQERQEIYSGIHALVPNASPEQVVAISRSFATNPQVVWSLISELDKRAQQKRLGVAGQAAAGVKTLGKGKDQVSMMPVDQGSPSDPAFRRARAQRLFQAAQLLRANAKTQKDLDVANSLEDQGNEILQGKTTTFDNKMYDVSGPTPRVVAQGTTQLEKLQAARDKAPEGSSARAELDAAIEKETGLTKDTVEKLLQRADMLDQQAEREPDKRVGDSLHTRANLMRARAQSLINKTGFSLKVNKDGSVEITQGPAPKYLTPTQQDKLQAQKDFLQRGMDMITGLNKVFKRDPTMFGGIGGARKTAKQWASLLEDLHVPMGKYIDEAASLFGDAISPEQKFQLLLDPKLSTLEKAQNQLAIILARTRQPNDRLLSQTLANAQRDTRLVGGATGSRDVGDRMNSVFKELQEAYKDVDARLKKGTSGKYTEGGARVITLDELEAIANEGNK